MGTLKYTDDSAEGITRRYLRGKPAYFSAAGERITNRDEIDRLNAVGLPPAYERCWYNPDADGHILAIGYDAKGRKQYRYHAGFRAQQDEAKYERCSAFGLALPRMRARVDADLESKGLGRERALASVVRLLDTGGIRVGNEAYVKENKSFGATTLRMRHAKLKGDTLHLRFKAKSGKQRDMRVTDRGLARFVKKMQDLPGQNLFQYVDDDGSPTPVTSSDVNAYIRETMGEDFTAKHFRTWSASALAYGYLHALPHEEGHTRIVLKPMLDHVSEALGNTPAMARNSYIHPRLVASAKGDLPLPSGKLPRATQWLEREERGLLAWLSG